MNQKGLAPVFIILGIAVTVAIAGGLYFLGKNSQSNLEQQKITPVTSQSSSLPQASPSIATNSTKITPSPTPTPDPIADWKIYSNQKYGYSLKYPSNLKSNESETTYNQYVEFTLGKDSSGNAYLPNYTVTVAKESFQAKDPVSVNFLSADWVSSFYAMKVGDTKTSQAITFKKLSNMTVAGQSGIVISVTATGDNQKRVFLKKNGYVYMISDFTNLPDFQNFLYSFKLTN